MRHDFSKTAKVRTQDGLLAVTEMEYVCVVLFIQQKWLQPSEGGVVQRYGAVEDS